MQSPIHIKNSRFAEFSKTDLQFHWGKATGFPTKGHGLRIDFEYDPASVLLLEGKAFALRQFHFHHPAEHFVEDSQSLVELHIVNQNLDDLTIAVVAVMINGLKEAEKGSKHSRTAKAIQDFAAQLAPREEEKPSLPVGVSTDPNHWLPSERTEYYRYEGSLTTEPYTESVSWVIMRQAIYISLDSLGELIKVLGHDARGLQPRNRRYLLRSFAK